MKAALLAATAALLIGAAGPAAAQTKPQRIVSLNVCTDELLLDLVRPDRIASLTYLSRSPSNSYLWPQARRVPVNHGLAEEVLAEHPDLVLAGTYTTTATRAVLKQIGMPLLALEPAENFEGIRTITRRVAAAVGESARGERLIAGMNAELAALANTKPKRLIRVAGWDGSGSVPGKGSLFDAILTAAGGTNIASAADGDRRNSFDIEQLLMARPDVLAFGADGATTPSLRTDSNQHPLVTQLYAHRRISYPEALYSCGVPESAGAARVLRARLLEAMTFPGPP